MVMTSGNSESRAQFPGLFNAYIETVFMGYPEQIKSFQMETSEQKAEDAKRLYQDVFNEEANF